MIISPKKHRSYIPRTAHRLYGLLAISMLTLITACQATEVNQITTCEPWARLALGEYTLLNNIWGKGDIKQYSQCISVEQPETSPHLSWSWSWSWPESDYSIKAYPAILYGRKPWYDSSTTDNLPIQIEHLNSLLISYSVSNNSDGAYNLLLESWVTTEKSADSDARIGELAIQLYQQNWQGQAGHYIETVRFGNFTFDFYIKEDMQVPGDDHTWVYYGFVNPGKMIEKGSIDMVPFMEYLVTKGYLDPKHYLASVELGNEIVNGTGKTVVDKFFITVDSTKTVH